MSTYRQPGPAPAVPYFWAQVCTATFVGALAAGLIVATVTGLAVRYYVHWSLQDAMKQVRDTQTKTR